MRPLRRSFTSQPCKSCAKCMTSPFRMLGSAERHSQSIMRLDFGRIVASFGFAGSGLVTLWKTQTNARVHSVATALVVSMAVWLPLAPSDLALLVFAIALVWAAEAMNTAVEATVDLVTEEHRPLARIAKDTAAAAVLVCAIGAAVVGVLILGPALLAWWQSSYGQTRPAPVH